MEEYLIFNGVIKGRKVEIWYLNKNSLNFEEAREDIKEKYKDIVTVLLDEPKRNIVIK